MIAALDPATRLTSSEAAEYLGKHPQTLQNWRSAGTGPAYIKGKPIMYRVSALEAYLDRETVAPIR